MRMFLQRLFAPSPSRLELERAYLDRSVSIYDLERRQREIAEGRFSRY